MKNKTEERVFSSSLKIEQRAEGDNKVPMIVGYAAVFDSLSENLGGFREQIAVGAFDGVLGDDVRCAFNHDPSMILGRTVSGTLRISVDGTGLRYECDPPDTQVARDLMVSLERKDVDQSSFRFTVDEDSWDEDDDGRVVRTIKKFKRLIDVSPVTYPAYPDTSVAQRSLDEWRDEIKKPEPNSYEDEQRALALQLADVE
ncbi:HK97 family phage prohead protease [Zhongshania marina]|uniref:HK97 family phage prohead protease n=1 Tax=Zhongshania marina TaxID=2304603 RepID=A0A2S4HGE7_9GAMM|nr:HK97 family phage prohead protease [Marortus luteolus]POP53072.1 HK97 family phage prohead protease [Marortus luteolus]